MSSKNRPPNVDAEYKMVRNEIDQKISLHNSLLTFTITTTVAILAIAAGNKNSNAFLYLLPFCVIIPMSIRIAYYRKAMAKLSSYLIVFCEEYEDSIKWETRNLGFYRQLNSDSKKFILNYYECFVLSVICYILFIYNYLVPKTDPDIKTIINCLWPIVLIIWEYQITAKINRIDRDRTDLIKVWESIKSEGNPSYTDSFYSDIKTKLSSHTFIQYNKGFGIYRTDEETGTKGIHKLGNSIDIFLIQSIIVFIYLGGQELATAIFPNDSLIISIVSLLSFVVVLLVTAVLTRILIVPRKYGFNVESYPVLFQIHLLCISIFFLIWKQFNSFILILTLYIGFSVSQSDLIQCKSVNGMFNHLLEPYRKAQVSFWDCIMFCLMDCLILSVSFLAPGKERILLMVIISILAFYYVIAGIRKKCTKDFCCAVFAKTRTNSKCLVWNIGHQNVVYHQLLKIVGLSSQDVAMDVSEPPMQFYDFIIVINTLHTKESYIRHLDKVEKMLKPNGMIVDPSILCFTKQRSIFFTLLGIPNPFAKIYNLNQYKSIISDWR